MEVKIGPKKKKLMRTDSNTIKGRIKNNSVNHPITTLDNNSGACSRIKHAVLLACSESFPVSNVLFSQVILME